MIRFRTRRSAAALSPRDQRVLHVATYNGQEIMSGRHLPALVAWVQEKAATGYTTTWLPIVTIPAGCPVVLPSDF